MKNTLLALLGFILLSAPLAATAQQSGDFTYTSDGSVVTITGYTGPGGVVTVPDTINGLPVTTIGDSAESAFSSELTGITIPDGVTSIGNYAFMECYNLTNVTMSGTVTGIGNYAFARCYSLTHVTIPDSVRGIGDYAFGGLTSVNIPASVIRLGVVPFQSINLLAIVVDAANPAYSSLDGVLFDKSQTTLLDFPGGKVGSYSIPGSVTYIGPSAFAGSSLTNVIIPGSVTSLGPSAFADSRLTSVTIPGSITSIGGGGFAGNEFAGCASLASVTILHGVIGIGDNAFAYCPNLTSVTIPRTVTYIGSYAFEYCTSLTSVTIPAGVAYIGNYAFAYCTHLKIIFFKGNAPGVGVNVFFPSYVSVYYLPGTTGWGATLDGAPTILWNPLMEISGVGPAGFGFNITGTTNIPIVIEAAANPANASWVPLQSLTLTNGVLHLTDPNWTNYPARFYRIRSP